MDHDVSAPAGWYPDQTTPGLLRYWTGQAWSDASARIVSQRDEQDLQLRIQQLRHERDALYADVSRVGDRMILEEIGIYKYAHPLDDAAAYKPLLEAIEEKCKALVKAGEAVTTTKRWAINGSDKEGAKMVGDFGKLVLRAYNNEVDNLIRTLKPHSVEASLARLDKLRASIAKLGRSMQLAVTDAFHDLRVQEIRLTADFLAKVAEQKEREREEKARLREEEIARKELEAENARLEKERTHYQTVHAALLAKGDVAAAAEAAIHIAELQLSIEGVTRRAANIRAGYVYVISNIGAFGMRMVKIGMTRRLQPMDRVLELGDASVPFRFDVHALIFSDDAVSLEGALHRAFERQRVNIVNVRREFFYATPGEVKVALSDLKCDLLTFTDAPIADEWFRSESARSSLLAASGSG